MRRLEDSERVDAPVAALGRIADRLLRSPPVVDGLRGTWAGHALHPLLTDFPLGAWMAASFLDLFGGGGDESGLASPRRLWPPGRRADRRAGLAEWQATNGVVRRVGVTHAAVNSTARLLYAGSWAARRRGAPQVGVALGLGGGVVAFVGGYLGGHLSLVRKIGTADEAFGEPEERDVTGDIGGVRGEGAGRPSQGSAEGDGMRRPTRA